MSWNSDQYLKFKAERTQPAVDLLSHVVLQKPAKVLDVGCGPGNSTYLLARCFASANVIGIDNSPEMLQRARQDYPDITFTKMDASGDLASLGDGYDLVFSNAALQWIPEHDLLLPNLLSLLRPGGILAVQIPMNFDEPIHAIIAGVTRSEEWRSYFHAPRIFHTLTPPEYYDILSPLTSKCTMWQTVYYHVMQQHTDILEWYRSTGLRPYLEALPPSQAPLFEEEILRRIKAAYAPQANGDVLFRFPRFFFTAVK